MQPLELLSLPLPIVPFTKRKSIQLKFLLIPYAVLANHVVAAEAFSTDLKDGEKVTTLGGATLTVHIREGRVYVANARVEYPNVITANGVVHVIDHVLDVKAN